MPKPTQKKSLINKKSQTTQVQLSPEKNKQKIEDCFNEFKTIAVLNQSKRTSKYIFNDLAEAFNQLIDDLNKVDVQEIFYSYLNRLVLQARQIKLANYFSG